MDHIAILRKGNILRNILNGSKTIESRWYVNKISPWNKVFKDDTVYFKESGNLVTARAGVSKVLQFDLTEDSVEDIVKKYGKKIDPDSTEKEFLVWAGDLGKKRYVILIFLEDVQEVESFKIDKTGYGISCAWMAVGSIEKVKV